MRIIIIGGGPGGYEAAIRGAQLGAEVVLIEQGPIGGTCLNHGCIPTKVMFKNASVVNTIKKAKQFGVVTSMLGIDPLKMQQTKSETIEALQMGIHALIKDHKIEYIHSTAELLDQHRILVNRHGINEIITGDRIILATGSEPIIPNIEGIEHQGLLTSADLLQLTEIPSSLTIIGAGVIGVEFAGIYNSLGTDVTLIDTAKHILPNLDSDIAKRLGSRFKKSGIKIVTGAKVNRLFDTSGRTTVEYTKKENISTITSDYVLLAVGRKPRLIKGLEKAGITYSKQGIAVNEDYCTNHSHIYAIGDVNGIEMLAHAASHQGHSAIEHILLDKPAEQKPVIPSCIFTFPEIALVGESERSLQEKNIAYEVSKFSFAHNGKAMTMQETFGYVKVIAVEDIIVGTQIIGPHASDLIHEASLGIQNQLEVSQYIQTVHAHPTLGEAFLEATRGLYNMAIHQAPIPQPKQVINRRTS